MIASFLTRSLGGKVVLYQNTKHTTSSYLVSSRFDRSLLTRTHRRTWRSQRNLQHRTWFLSASLLMDKRAIMTIGRARKVKFKSLSVSGFAVDPWDSQGMACYQPLIISVIFALSYYQAKELILDQAQEEAKSKKKANHWRKSLRGFNHDRWERILPWHERL